jgi:hypothetical protein
MDVEIIAYRAKLGRLNRQNTTLPASVMVYSFKSLVTFSAPADRCF